MHVTCLLQARYDLVEIRAYTGPLTFNCVTLDFSMQLVIGKVTTNVISIELYPLISKLERVLFKKYL